MPEKIPTIEEWGRLYAAAGRVKEMAPWEWMMEDDVFGVRNPERDEIGFVSVMGAGGEHFAGALYQGAAALYDFLALSEAGRDGRGDSVVAGRVLEIPQLQASFEDRGHLQKEDRDVIKKLGLKFRGANSWPMLRPGNVPLVSDLVRGAISYHRARTVARRRPSSPRRRRLLTWRGR